MLLFDWLMLCVCQDGSMPQAEITPDMFPLSPPIETNSHLEVPSDGSTPKYLLSSPVRSNYTVGSPIYGILKPFTIGYSLNLL